MKKTKYWVRFYTPGSFTANTRDSDIEEGTHANDIIFPDNAYAFTLRERTDIHEEGEVFKGKPTDSKLYYHPDSQIENLGDIPDTPANNILRKNMINNNWHSVIFTRWHNWPQRYDQEKVIVL